MYNIALHWDIIEYPDYKRCPDFRVSTYATHVPVFNSSIAQFMCRGFALSALVFGTEKKFKQLKTAYPNESIVQVYVKQTFIFCLQEPLPIRKEELDTVYT